MLKVSDLEVGDWIIHISFGLSKIYELEGFEKGNRAINSNKHSYLILDPRYDDNHMRFITVDKIE